MLVVDKTLNNRISDATKIADLKVISRTSAQHYIRAPANLPEIARQRPRPDPGRKRAQEQRAAAAT